MKMLKTVKISKAGLRELKERDNPEYFLLLSAKGAPDTEVGSR